MGVWVIVVFAVTQHTFGRLVPTMMKHHWIATAGALLIAVVSIRAGIDYPRQVERFLPRLDFEGARGKVAISGLAIFCFVFVRGSNFDYRLIFLLGVVAYLVQDLDETGTMRSLPACVGLLLFLWAPYANRPLVTEMLDGLVFAGGSLWLGTALIYSLRDSPAGGGAGEIVRPAPPLPGCTG